MNNTILLEQLQQERAQLAKRINTTTALLYEGTLPAHDLVTEQLQAMDQYFQSLSARIEDIKNTSRMCSILEDDEEEKEECHCGIPGFDAIVDNIYDKMDELLDLIHANKDPLADIKGKTIIDTNPKECHSCDHETDTCRKVVLAGDERVCVDHDAE